MVRFTSGTLRRAQVGFLSILLACTLAACGSVSVGSGTGGSGTSNPASGPGQSETNSPPEISGTPATSVIAGQGYAFVPTASDPDGDALVFSITNQPDWASFDAATGLLNGTPPPAAVGTDADITISVSDGQATVSLATF